jgi:DNA adenine methylase
MKSSDVIIKWTGSKRSQALQIIRLFNHNIETYYEPFCGGCSVLFELLTTKSIKVNKYVCSDLNNDLISLWQTIKSNPNELFDYYNKIHTELVSLNDIDKRKQFYLNIRDKFNSNHNPYDFFFLNRTSYNGLIRYNSNGDYNVAYHSLRNGIEPERLHINLLYFSKLLNGYNVQFICRSYENVAAEPDDFLYLDPPYANSSAMYFNGFNSDIFFDWLRNQSCSYLLSYDGYCGDDNLVVNVPNDVYDYHTFIKSGNSSFRNLKSTEDRYETVFESIYLKNIDDAENKIRKINGSTKKLF